MTEKSELAKQDKKLAGETMCSLVSDLLGEHTDKIYAVHKKMDGTLGVNIRLSLKHDDGKLALTS